MNAPAFYTPFVCHAYAPANSHMDVGSLPATRTFHVTTAIPCTVSGRPVWLLDGHSFTSAGSPTIRPSFWRRAGSWTGLRASYSSPLPCRRQHAHCHVAYLSPSSIPLFLHFFATSFQPPGLMGRQTDEQHFKCLDCVAWQHCTWTRLRSLRVTAGRAVPLLNVWWWWRDAMGRGGLPALIRALAPLLQAGKHKLCCRTNDYRTRMPAMYRKRAHFSNAASVDTFNQCCDAVRRGRAILFCLALLAEPLCARACRAHRLYTFTLHAARDLAACALHEPLPLRRAGLPGRTPTFSRTAN